VGSRKALQTEKNEWKSKFTKIGMIIKYLRTLSINGVCVPYAYSMHVRALAAWLKKLTSQETRITFILGHGSTTVRRTYIYEKSKTRKRLVECSFLG
jgi:hypothetical protein